MPRKKTSRKSEMSEADIKQMKAEFSKTAKKHFPNLKKAADKALRAAGVTGLQVHGMTFRVNTQAMAGQCNPPCDPKTERCVLSSTGDWVCVPKS